MKFRSCLALNACVVSIVLVSLLMSQMTYGQAPIVTHDELKQALVNSAHARKENLAQVRGKPVAQVNHRTEHFPSSQFCS